MTQQARPRLPAVLAPCGITRTTKRHTWVCVRPIHDTEKDRGRQRDKRGYAPQAERHIFVRAEQ